MYTNGNLEAHLAALLFLGCTALIFLLLIAAAILFFVRRRWAPYPLLAIGVVVMGYGLLLAVFSYTSYDRTAARGDEKYFCEMDCHIAYSVLNVEHTKFIGDATAHGVRDHQSPLAFRRAHHYPLAGRFSAAALIRCCCN